MGQTPVTLTGTATIAGTPRTHSVGLTLAIQAGGRTALAGQFRAGDDTPLPGVRLTLAGVTTTDPRGHPTTHRFGPDRLPREVADALG